MSLSAILFMSTTWTLVIGLSVFCLWRMMKSPSVVTSTSARQVRR